MQPNVQTLHAAAVKSNPVVAPCPGSVPGSPSGSLQGEGLHSSPTFSVSKSVSFATTIVKVDEVGIECFQNRELNEFFSAKKGRVPNQEA